MATSPVQESPAEVFNRLYHDFTLQSPDVSVKMLFDAAEKAAEEDHVPALAFTGAMLVYGHPDVEKDPERGAQFLRRAFEAGSVGSGLTLGRYYIETKNPEMAFPYFAAISEQNHPEALTIAGQMYAQGAGTDKDEFKAIDYFERATDQKYLPAFVEMGRLYEEGSPLVRDLEMARISYELLLDEAAKLTDPEAIAEAKPLQQEALNALCYFQIEGLGGVKDLPQGFHGLDQLRQEGYAPAITLLQNYEYLLGKEEVNGFINTAPTLIIPPQKEIPKIDETIFAELDSMIGLDDVKQQVRDLAKLAFIQQQCKKQGIPTQAQSLHTVFTGNPGTGKTEVARVIGKIMHKMGVLEKDTFVEVDKSKLVGAVIGATEAKTAEVLAKANGGVLLVDEAYALVAKDDDSKDFGRIAFETIMKYAEDHRDTLMVILTGYSKEMEHAIASNPGINSRFPNKFNFADYNGAELGKIFDRFSAKIDRTLSPDGREAVQNYFDSMKPEQITTFANGRGVRTLFEQAMQAQARRLYDEGKWERQDLLTLTGKDVNAALEKMKKLAPKAETKGLGYIGFVDPNRTKPTARTLTA